MDAFSDDWVTVIISIDEIQPSVLGLVTLRAMRVCTSEAVAFSTHAILSRANVN